MKAVIVGGGIAGPVLGMFCARIGIESVICEAQEGCGGGAFLGIAPNGMNVLASLGLDRALLARGHVSHGFRFLNGRGAAIGAIDQTADRASYGQPMVMVRRAVLHELLLAEARARGVEVRLGTRIEAIEAAPDQVRAQCRDGHVVTGDLLVGCDGLSSRTRALVMPDAPSPAYAGLLDFGGFCQALPGDPLTPGENTMCFGRKAFFGAFVTEQGELWWFHNGSEPAQVHSLDEPARRARLLAAHARDPAWIGAAIARTPHILGPWPMHVVEGLPRWHRGRVCLLGDAAHAMTPSAGQGASLAMEDAMLLGRCLKDEREPAAAFARFEQLQRPRVEQIAAHARRTSSKKTESGPIAGWFRDRMLATFLKLGAKAQRSAHAHRVEWT